MKRDFTLTQKISGLCFIFTVVMLLVGTIKLGWYINEIAALFIIMMLVIGLVSRFTPSQIAQYLSLIHILSKRGSALKYKA